MIDAERALLGIALTGARDLDRLLVAVQPGDFYQPIHGLVWEAIGRVHAAGNTPDPVSVRLALGHLAPKQQVDPTRLVELMAQAPVAAQGEWYAEQVAAAAVRRDIADAGRKVVQIGENEQLGVAEAQDMARQAVDGATTSRGVTSASSLASVLPEVIDVAERGEASALSSPWDDVDRVIGGIAPGRLVVVGARPGVGKSLFGTNLALHMAHQHGHASLLASIEMTKREVTQRLLAAHARANLSGLLTGRVPEAEWTRINDKYAELEAMPITIDDSGSQTVTSIRSAARDIGRARDDLALIVVDYLQLMASATSRDNRAQEVADMSRGLKVLARETNTCVVALAQVNREGAKHGDGRPRMTDLRESGAIEADADQVILLHRPNDDTPEVEVIVPKNRWGPPGLATLHIQGHYARLASAQWTPTRGIA